ncbi:hypothetical protein AAKU58_004330 [Oxalobacteraceae bacterium GrIS 1.18]
MAEPHWRQFPYPEESVFLVIGGRIDGTSVDSNTLTPFIIVGHSEEAACKEWLNLAGHKRDYSALTCSSIKQMGDFLALLDAASKSPEQYIKIPSSKIQPVDASREPWLIGVSRPDEEAGHGEVVMAFGSSDIEEWASKKGLSLISVLPRSGLVSTIAEMKKTQTGKVDEGYYAEGPNDIDDMLANAKTWPASKWAQYDALLAS